MPTKTKEKTKEKASKNSQVKEQQKHARVLLDKWLKTNALDAQSKDVKSTLTADDAKRILGWAEVEKNHHLVDCNGKKIVCHNNRNNRLFREGDARAVAQDMLNRNFAFNAESIVVGCNGNVLSGQCRLIGLVFAEQLRVGPQSHHWAAFWDSPVTIEAVVLYNVDESSKTTRTLDNTRTRTLADSLFSDPKLVKGSDGKAYSVAQRKQIARLLEQSIRTVWRRTGQGDNLFHSKKTNSEMLAFRDRHPKIADAVKHIFEEDGEGRRISGPGRWLPAGISAGLLYLMGLSKTDGDTYRNLKPDKDGVVLCSEKGADLSMWDKACEFWVMLAATDKDDDFCKNLRKVRRPVDDPNDKTSGYIFNEGTTQERSAAICKAWKVFLSDEKPTPGLFKLAYTTSEKTGLPILDEDPEVGGIDLGNNPYRPAVPSEPTATDEAPKGEPTPEEIEQQAQAIKEENATAAGATITGNLD